MDNRMESTLEVDTADISSHIRPVKRVLSAPVEFIQTQPHDLILPPPPDYIFELGRFGTEEDIEELQRLKLYEAADEGRKCLLLAVHKYRAATDPVYKSRHKALKSQNPNYDPINYVINELHSWADVMDEVQAAKRNYTSKEARGWSGKIRACLRRFGEHSVVLSSWLKLFPDQCFAKTIVGGFHIILEAAHTLHSLRELVYETLADIPEKLSNAKKYVDIYINSRTSSQAITNHSSELYVCITEVLRHILDFFSKHALSRVAGSLVRLDNFEKCLKDHVSRMDVVLQRLMGAVTLCQHQREKQIHELMMKSHDVTIKSEEILLDVSNDLSSVKEQMKDVREIVTRETKKLEVDHADFENRLATTVLNALVMHLSSIPIHNLNIGGIRNTGASAPSSERSYPNSPRTSDTDSVSSVALVDVLVQLEMRLSPSEDITRAMAFAHDLDPAEIDRVVAIIKSPELASFLTSTSCSLLINGNTLNDDFKSATSYFAGRLVTILTAIETSVTLCHFCSLHVNMGDPEADVTTMMTSLLHQLLSQLYDRGLEIDIPDFDADFNLNALFKTFANTIEQLDPRTPIFLVLDSISSYEDRLRRDSILAIVWGLDLLIQNGQCRNLKVMYTASRHAHYVHQYVRSVLTLDEYVDGDRQGRRESDERDMIEAVDSGFSEGRH